MPFGPDKVIARRAALELARGDAVNLGFGISPLVPLILLEEGCDDAVTWAIEQGPVGGIPAAGFVFGCAFNAQAIIPSPAQFTYFQGAGFDLCMLSFLEIDREGSVNVSRLSARPHVTAGCGGFIDITAHAKRIVFSGYFRAGVQLAVEEGKLRILKEGKVAKLVPEVEHVTFSGRRARAQGPAGHDRHRALRPEARKQGLVVAEIAPGVDLERDVLSQAAIPLVVARDLKTMDPGLFRPSAHGPSSRAARRMSAKWYEEVEPGERFATGGIVVAESHVMGFAGLTGDFFDLHVDDEFAREARLPRARRARASRPRDRGRTQESRRDALSRRGLRSAGTGSSRARS